MPCLDGDILTIVRPEKKSTVHGCLDKITCDDSFYQVRVLGHTDTKFHKGHEARYLPGAIGPLWLRVSRV
jgi:hypothetical protein